MRHPFFVSSGEGTERKTLMKLHFDHAPVARLLAHATAAKEHLPTFEQSCDPAFLSDGKVDHARIPAGLMLVGDDGLYLMSNGMPALSDPQGRANLVAYAREADPKTSPEESYDIKRAAFGDDDGVEFLAADVIRNALEATAGGALWLDVTPSRISAPCLAPPRRNAGTRRRV